MRLEQRRALIVGLGRSGIAAARACHRRGARVTVTDRRPPAELGDALAALPPGVTVDLGGHREAVFREQDLVVLSPGVPPLPELAASRGAGAEILGELELAFRLLQAEVVAITGTNGKSTTTALTGSLLAALGRPLFVGGNLGTPLCDAVDTDAGQAHGLCVAEVSSYQLETVSTFHPRAAALLNVTEDHLERHGSFECYAATKARIFARQTEHDMAVVNAADRVALAAGRGGRSRLWTFGDPKAEQGAALADGDIVVRGFGAEERYPLSELPLAGRHNHENAMAAFLLARRFGVPPAEVRARAAAFHPLPHRMERVAEGRGLVFYDDSKGTNVASVVKSLDGFPRPVVLLAGGRDKGGDLAPLREVVARHARAVVLLGEATARFAAGLGGAAPLAEARDLEDAVLQAVALARPGDAVVLSPGCASFDMFRNFEHRGQAFRAAVRRWLDHGR